MPPAGLGQATYALSVAPDTGTTPTRTGPLSFRLPTPICPLFPYTFIVTARRADGATLTSAPASAFGCVAPGRVQQLGATTADGSVTITWQPPADPGTTLDQVYYDVSWFYDNPGAGVPSPGGSTQINPGQPLKLQVSAPLGTHVFYGVQTVNFAGEGPLPQPAGESIAWNLADCASPAGTCTYNHQQAVPLETTPGGASAGVSLPPVPSNTFGAPVTVLCQTLGPTVTLPAPETWAQSYYWDKVTYGGVTGYVNDLMISTTNSMATLLTTQYSFCF